MRWQWMLGMMVCLLAEPATAEMREWTGARGLKITGEFVEIKTNHSLDFKEYHRNEIHYEYHPHLTLTHSIVSATIKGPWGPRVLTIEQPRQGALALGNYVLTPLYRGYSIHKYLGTGKKTPPIRFTVE